MCQSPCKWVVVVLTCLCMGRTCDMIGAAVHPTSFEIAPPAKCEWGCKIGDVDPIGLVSCQICSR